MPENNISPTGHIWCAIPVFNNKDTVKEVALGCRKYLEHIIVIDDGSTDCDIKQMFSNTDVIVLRHDKNLGKGRALRTALSFIKEKRGEFMLAIDADGQHYPDDIKSFIPYFKIMTRRLLWAAVILIRKRCLAKAVLAGPFLIFGLSLKPA